MMTEIVCDTRVAFSFLTGRQPFRNIITKNKSLLLNGDGRELLIVERMNMYQSKAVYKVIAGDPVLLREYRKPVKHNCIHVVCNDTMKSYAVLGTSLIGFDNPKLDDEGNVRY